MAWNGSGGFVMLEDFPQDRDDGAPDHFIDADKMDNELQNIKGGLENTLTRTGETLPSSNIPWNAKKLTGLGDATAATDAMNRQASDARYLNTAGDTLTGQLLFPDATVAAPAIAFATELDMGIYVEAANIAAFGVAGAKVQSWHTTGIEIVGSITVTADPGAADEVGDMGFNDARYCLEANDLSDVADADTAWGNLGGGAIGKLATINNDNWSGADLALTHGGTGASLVDPGADRIMFWDDSAGATAYLTAGANLTITTTSIAVSGALLVANDLDDVADAGTARTNLGLGALAVLSTVNNGEWSGTDLAVVNGGTGASTIVLARSGLAIGNIANSLDSGEGTTGRDITQGTGAPSGGSNGDLHFRYS